MSEARKHASIRGERRRWSDDTKRTLSKQQDRLAAKRDLRSLDDEQAAEDTAAADEWMRRQGFSW